MNSQQTQSNNDSNQTFHYYPSTIRQPNAIIFRSVEEVNSTREDEVFDMDSILSDVSVNDLILNNIRDHQTFLTIKLFELEELYNEIPQENIIIFEDRIFDRLEFKHMIKKVKRMIREITQRIEDNERDGGIYESPGSFEDETQFNDSEQSIANSIISGEVLGNIIAAREANQNGFIQVPQNNFNELFPNQNMVNDRRGDFGFNGNHQFDYNPGVDLLEAPMGDNGDGVCFHGDIYEGCSMCFFGWIMNHLESYPNVAMFADGDDVLLLQMCIDLGNTGVGFDYTQEQDDWDIIIE